MQTIPYPPVFRAFALRRVLLVAMLCAALPALALAPRPVSAHTLLLSASPAEGATVDTSLDTLTLTFDENPQPGFSKIVVYDASQRPVLTTTNPSTGPTPSVLVVGVPSLKTGGYAVVWQVLSSDGHVARGAYTFTVQLPGEAKAAPPPEISTVLSASANTPSLLAITLAALRYAGLGALVGGIGVLLFCVLPALAALGDLSDETRRRVRRTLDLRAQRWLFIAFGAALAAHLLILVAQGAKATNTGLLDALRYDLLTDLIRNTTFGAVWRVQAIALLLFGEWLVLLPGAGRWRLFGASRRAGVGVGITAHPLPAARAADAPAPPIPLWGWGVALAGGLFLLGSTVLGGHAASIVWHPALGMLADWTHLAAMSLWFGGLLLLALVVPSVWAGVEVPTQRRAVAAIITRFSNLALVAIAVVTVTGIYNATQHTSPATLTTTGYGLALVGKVALVGCVLLVAAVNRFVVHPQMRRDAGGASAGRAQTFLTRLIGAEVVLALGVLGLTGLLTQLPPAFKPAPPPRVIAEATAQANLSEVVPNLPALTVGDVRAALSVDAHDANVRFETRITDAANRPRADVGRVNLLLNSGDRNVGTITVPMEDTGGGRFTAAGNWFSVGQHWLARVVVARPGTEDTVLNFALQPRPVTPVETQGAASAFPWPRFEPAAGIGAVLALLGLAVTLAARFAPVPFGARERRVYQWGGVAVVVVGVIVAGWFSVVAAPLVR